ncbi:MAG: fatty acid--CoA ligase family protein [Verrucomicrobiota bacterium]
MSIAAAFVSQLAGYAEREALVCGGRVTLFSQLHTEMLHHAEALRAAGVQAGDVVTLEADYSAAAVAALLALFHLRAIAVPLTPATETKKAHFRALSGASWSVTVDEAGHIAPLPLPHRIEHPLLGELRGSGHGGLVLFSSGSTGAHKAAVHDIERLLAKYMKPRHCLRTLAFLQFDHIGGLDTLFYSLANGSCLIAVDDRSPEAVCAAIAAHRVEVLPVSPSFINLLLLSGAHHRHDLSSLRVITYGAEVMPEATLVRLHAEFPDIKLLQKFGTTEIGTLRSQSRESGSVWVKVGGEGCAIRIVDGLLEIKAPSAMLGYLNAPSPFTDDGWFKTGDAVDVDGEWLRILGRRVETINVGGEKVFPAEVEGVLEELAGVEEATVVGEANAILGNIVVARVKLTAPESLGAFRSRMLAHCRARLPAYKIPQKVVLTEHSSATGRFKKLRQHAPVA